MIMKLNLVVTILLFFVSQFCIKAQNLDKQYIPGEFIVKLKENQSTAKTSTVHSHLITNINANLKKTYTFSNTQLWQLSSAANRTDLIKVIDELKNHPGIEFVEPNYIYSATEIPNDPAFSQQWALANDYFNEGTPGVDIDAVEAWAVQSTSPSIVVGLIDSGVDWRHPDLIDNIWQNLAEDADNDGRVLEYDTANNIWVFDPDDIDGIDNDNNGYIDDFIGWNFVDNNNQPFDYNANIEDVSAHGTHVAGILGAVGNNGIGVTGVSWDIQIAPLKYLSDENSEGTASNAIEAIEYAAQMGMPLSNNSWGGAPFSIALYQAIATAQFYDHIFIAAAGNGGFDNIGDNNDVKSFYPASYNVNSIISVANTNNNDGLSSSSNFGVLQVDIAAPGTNIMSCLPGGNYGSLSGTSMATPFVTGAVALFLEKYPNKTLPEIKNAILNNVDTLPALTDKCVSQGRLNLYNTVTAFDNTVGNPTTTGCRNRDSLALVAFFESTNGINWYDDEDPDYKKSWDLTKPMSDWYGVYFTTEGCVNKLTLSDFNITGTLPVEIGDLSELDYLDLRNNAIGGMIPPEIGNLIKLERLFLNSNELTGPIPVEMGEMRQLRECILYFNQLSGDIPLELFNLLRLTYLSLGPNNLTGNIPTEIGNLINLERLHLTGNQFTGSIPTEISNLKKLEHLGLGFNNFTGEIPAGIGNLSNLNSLYLDNNNLEGSIPGELGNLDFTQLRLNNNNLSGCYDPHLKNMGNPNFPIYSYDNSEISDNNNFDAPWEDFMNNNAGACWASAVTQVWPGDFNNDGQVSNDDLVFYGIAAGNSGAVRQTVSNHWEGNLCPGWNNEIYGVNGKHQDANGDGVVDILDRNIIIANFGLNNYDENDDLNEVSYSTIDIGFTLEEITTAETLSNSNLIKHQYALKVDNDNIKGFSCTIDFKTALDESSTAEAFQNCIDPDIVNAVFDYENGILELGITNTGDDVISCIDGLARIVVIVVEENLEEGEDDWVVKINGITSEV